MEHVVIWGDDEDLRPSSLSIDAGLLWRPRGSMVDSRRATDRGGERDDKSVVRGRKPPAKCLIIQPVFSF